MLCLQGQSLALMLLSCVLRTGPSSTHMMQADQLFGRLLSRSPGLVFEPALMGALLDAAPPEDVDGSSAPRLIQRTHQVTCSRMAESLGACMNSCCWQRWERPDAQALWPAFICLSRTPSCAAQPRLLLTR